jgi:plasmid stability protein
MATITIRKLEERVKTRLRLRAARHGRSMEEEAREILKAGLVAEPTAGPNLAESIRRHLAPVGGVELRFPARELVRKPPSLNR